VLTPSQRYYSAEKETHFSCCDLFLCDFLFMYLIVVFLSLRILNSLNKMRF